MKTKTGEVTVWADDVRRRQVPRPAPEKHAGLQDVEIRYRQRYTDLWANPETMKVFEQSARIVGHIRRFMESRGYLEVETPMLQSLAGGAAARPFVTKMNALDINLFTHRAELYLKRRLCWWGDAQVFEINQLPQRGPRQAAQPRVHHARGLHAFGDVETVMELTESAIRDVAMMVHPRRGGSGDAVLPFGDLH